MDNNVTKVDYLHIKTTKNNNIIIYHDKMLTSRCSKCVPHSPYKKIFLSRIVVVNYTFETKGHVLVNVTVGELPINAKFSIP